MASASVLPSWLYASWSRNYIKRAGADGVLGAPDSSVSVRYIQTEAAGHAFDIRIADDFTLSETARFIDDLDLTSINSRLSDAHFVRTDDAMGLTRAAADEAVIKLQRQRDLLRPAGWRCSHSLPDGIALDDAPLWREVCRCRQCRGVA